MATQRKSKTAAATGKPTASVKPSSSSRGALKPGTPNDYEGARQLLSRYCTLIDRGKWVELSELFQRRAIFSVSYDSANRHVGREAILAWYTNFFKGRRGKFRHARHKLFEPCLSVDGNKATSCAYFDSDFVEPGSKVRVLAGRYDDILIKERGRWLFKERSITVLYNYSPGTAHEGMAL